MKIINSYKKLSQSNTNLAKKLTRNKKFKIHKNVNVKLQNIPNLLHGQKRRVR